MSFELNDVGSRVLYVNFRSEGDGIKTTQAEQLFSFSSLIEDSSKYLCAIERFRIGIQSIAMQDSLANAIILVSKTAAPNIFVNLTTSFSLYEWLLQIQNSAAPISVILTADGRAQILNFDFANFSIELSPRVADIFDLEEKIDGAGIQNIIGATPLFDRFDQLYKINIEALSGLSNLQQEIIDTNVFTTILTDFIIPSDHGMSVTNTLGTALTNQINFSFPVRQDLEFNASSNRRFISFRGSAPIQNLAIRVTAIFRDGSRNEIIIPRNGVFELKLSFWKRGK